jgi:hypothetical protein
MEVTVNIVQEWQVIDKESSITSTGQLQMEGRSNLSYSTCPQVEYIDNSIVDFQTTPLPLNLHFFNSLHLVPFSPEIGCRGNNN